jgi:hypothetical protein
MKKIIPFAVIFVVLVMGIVGWSFINKPTQISIQNVTQPPQGKIVKPITPTIEVNPSITGTAPLVYVNPSVVIDAIETAVPEKKWSDLSAFMTPNVTLIKYASSCCGVITKSQAIAELSYLNSATAPWNFKETNPIAKKLEANDPEHFKEMWIGTSKDYYAVGFKWNDNFLIEKISIVNDYRTITGN